MLQAALADCLFLDFLPFPQNDFVPSEVDIGGRDVVQTLVVALVVVVIDEGPDLTFEIARQIVIFQQHPVFHRLMPASPLPGSACLHAREEHLVDGRGFVRELISGLDHHIIGCRDQVGCFQNEVCR